MIPRCDFGGKTNVLHALRAFFGAAILCLGIDALGSFCCGAQDVEGQAQCGEQIASSIAESSLGEPSNAGRRMMLVVVGAPGKPEFATTFAAQAAAWERSGNEAGFEVLMIGRSNEHDHQEQMPEPVVSTSDSERFIESLGKIAEMQPTELWIILVGHGTFDGRQAKFNLAGPDLSGLELKEWLAQFTSDVPIVIINTASASGGMLRELTGKNRIVITATKSGAETNLTRFGEYMARAVTAREADLDKDQHVSLLEAFLSAARQTQDFYDTDSRLATEHPLLEDNGDGRGTSASWFQGIRVVGRSPDGTEPDGPLAHQVFLFPRPMSPVETVETASQRRKIELEIERLIRHKGDWPEDEYYRRLEELFVNLARLNRGS